MLDHLLPEGEVLLLGEAVALDGVHLEHVHHPGLVIGEAVGDLEILAGMTQTLNMGKDIILKS